jgi:alkylhydroperoxidase family enzyme
MHTRDLLRLGMTVDKLVLVPVWRDSGEVFRTRERVAQAWAETVTRVAETPVPGCGFQSMNSPQADASRIEVFFW